MSISSALWAALARLPMPLAARFASTLYRDRRFSVSNGRWVNEQADGTLVSPDLNAKRLSLIEEATRDEWFWDGKPSGIVFDIGAGIGEEALVMSPLASHVYAIEAHPEVFACLVETIRRSGLTNVTPIHCAIADKDGEVLISDDAGHLTNGIGGAEGIPVAGRSLESLCAELNIETIDFLKMNIEGAERLAVKGFGNLAIHRVAISCHDFIPGNFTQTRDIVRAALENRGYTVKRRADHERPWTRNNLYGTLGNA